MSITDIIGAIAKFLKSVGRTIYPFGTNKNFTQSWKC